MKAILFSIFLIMPTLLKAEYRVFLLKISKKAPQSPNTAADKTKSPAEESFRLVESTLDPNQYPYYYPITQDEIVTYVDTWRCFGNTSDFKELCPNPKKNQNENPVREPASNTK